MSKPGMLTVEELERLVDLGEIDTVVVVITDMQGRLQGKRLHARYFLDEVLAHGTEGCNYLLAVDVDMNTVDGYAMSSWETRLRRLRHDPRPRTLRHVPWQPGTVMLIADLAWHDGSDVVASPRQILKRQPARLADAGLQAFVGTELEFIVFNDTYEEAWDAGYRDLTPANQYNVDYSMLGTARVEPLLRRIRNEMAGAGMTVESAKGECNLGQHEIAFRYDEATVACDQHVIYKNGAKEIAAQEGRRSPSWPSSTSARATPATSTSRFRGTDGALVMADDADEATACRPWAAPSSPGQLAAHARPHPALRAEHQLVQALRRRLVRADRRRVGPGQPHLRAPPRRSRAGLRLENRVPGGDVNPYLAVAGLVAAGLDGIERGLELEDAFDRQRLRRPTPNVSPTRWRAPWRSGRAATFARETFGDEVVDALRQHGPGRAGRVRRGRHRLGALPRLRAPVTATTDVALGREHVRRRQPGDRAGRPHRRPRRRRRDRPRDRGGRARLSGLAGARPGRPRPAAAPLRRPRRRAPRGAGPARGPQRRPHHRQRPLGGGQRPRRPALLLRGAGAAVRPADPGRRAASTSPSRNRSASSA